MTTWTDDGQQECKGLYLHRDIAVSVAAGRGGWGLDGDVKSVTVDVVIYVDPTSGREITRVIGEVASFDFVDNDEMKTRALAKLTDGERDALGLRAPWCKK